MADTDQITDAIANDATSPQSMSADGVSVTNNQIMAGLTPERRLLQN